jgi:hypothetical protein
MIAVVLPSWFGLTGSTSEGCTERSATSRRRSLRRCSPLRCSRSNSKPEVSRNPGRFIARLRQQWLRRRPRPVERGSSIRDLLGAGSLAAACKGRGRSSFSRLPRREFDDSALKIQAREFDDLSTVGPLVLGGLILRRDPEVDHRVHRSSSPSSCSSATARSTSARASGPSAPGPGGSGPSSPGHAGVVRAGVVSGASRVSAEALPILSRRRRRSRSVLGASARRGVKGHVGAAGRESGRGRDGGDPTTVAGIGVGEVAT